MAAEVQREPGCGDGTGHLATRHLPRTGPRGGKPRQPLGDAVEHVGHRVVREGHQPLALRRGPAGHVGHPVEQVGFVPERGCPALLAAIDIAAGAVGQVDIGVDRHEPEPIDRLDQVGQVADVGAVSPRRGEPGLAVGHVRRGAEGGFPVQVGRLRAVAQRAGIDHGLVVADHPHAGPGAGAVAARNAQPGQRLDLAAGADHGLGQGLAGHRPLVVVAGGGEEADAVPQAVLRQQVGDRLPARRLPVIGQIADDDAEVDALGGHRIERGAKGRAALVEHPGGGHAVGKGAHQRRSLGSAGLHIVQMRIGQDGDAGHVPWSVSEVCGSRWAMRSIQSEAARAALTSTGLGASNHSSGRSSRRVRTCSSAASSEG